MIRYRLLAILATTLPAGLCSLAAFLTLRKEYDTFTYYVISLVFLTSSIVVGVVTAPLGARSRSPFVRWGTMAGSTTMAWIAAMATLGLLNMTPLCVGQDNGDGNNNLVMCAVYTILVALVYTPGILALTALSAAAATALASWIKLPLFSPEPPA